MNGVSRNSAQTLWRGRRTPLLFQPADLRPRPGAPNHKRQRGKRRDVASSWPCAHMPHTRLCRNIKITEALRRMSPASTQKVPARCGLPAAARAAPCGHASDMWPAAAPPPTPATTSVKGRRVLPASAANRLPTRHHRVNSEYGVITVLTVVLIYSMQSSGSSRS